MLKRRGNRKGKDHEIVRVQIESHATLFEREKQVGTQQAEPKGDESRLPVLVAKYRQ